MSYSCNNDVIDLTESFTLADHNGLNDTVIDLLTDADDSTLDTSRIIIQSNSDSTTSELHFNATPHETITTTIDILRKKEIPKKSLIPIKKDHKKQASIKNSKVNSSKFGECPICWDELGKNLLASTKCGHVYCLKCLERSLKNEKRCPCCRRTLRGSSAYHPLYLAKQ